MSEAILRLEDIALRRSGGLVLSDISLELYRDEMLTLLGPNGSGKSTLLHVIGLLRRPNHGTIYFHGQPVPWDGDLLSLRRRMATVFQQPLLLDTTVAGNVALGLRLRGVSNAEAQPRVGSWLDRLGIASLAGRSARQLSGGEAQRVSLARALVIEPEVLLLDEPFKELDTPTREALVEELKGVLQETRTTTVFVTHDRTEALRLSDRVAVLHNGHLLQTGTTEEVFNRPASHEVAAFVGVETILPGRIIAAQDGVATVEVADGRALAVASELPAGMRVLVCIRPEDVTLYADGAAGSTSAQSSARNRFPGRITQVQQRGSLYSILVDCGFPLAALVTKQSLVELNLVPGRQVEASFKATAAHVIQRGS
ncbi:MAG: ABC transporter ATP-binding protein [Bacteroidetes bacterium]|nr:ABC transporter ATP-binding protein [Bacteroidota bacterium]MCL5025571.1 ABC transporter ATP-binding protein [Chloroflexota bacterium]